MVPRLLSILFAIGSLVGGPWAQAPADLKSRLIDLRQIPIHPGLNLLENAEGDGRDAQVFCAWRDNGNAWSYRLYVVTMTQPPVQLRNGTTIDEGSESKWSIVGIETMPNGQVPEITDTPHTGEDAVLSVRFARGTLDGQPATLLITAERHFEGPVPDPVVASIRIYALKRAPSDVGTTPDVFAPVMSFTTSALYSDANAALNKELGLPLESDR